MVDSISVYFGIRHSFHRHHLRSLPVPIPVPLYSSYCSRRRLNPPLFMIFVPIFSDNPLATPSLEDCIPPVLYRRTPPLKPHFWTFFTLLFVTSVYPLLLRSDSLVTYISGSSSSPEPRQNFHLDNPKRLSNLYPKPSHLSIY